MIDDSTNAGVQIMQPFYIERQLLNLFLILANIAHGIWQQQELFKAQ